MDIDNIKLQSINYLSNVRIFNKQTKFWDICGNQGHLAKDCYFNPYGTNRNNPRVKNNNKIINYKNNRNNNKIRSNYKRRNNNTINNIKCFEEKEFTPYYEEIYTMHGKFINSIKHIISDVASNH